MTPQSRCFGEFSHENHPRSGCGWNWPGQFLLKGDYDNADRQFRFARAGDIDDAVKGNVDRFLSAINRLREWTVNVALAPDTNQNAATSASQVNIFGLPFALGQGARKTSGIGLAGDIGGNGHRCWATI